MIITILSDNCVGRSVKNAAEHGFSAYIEVNGKAYLFDTGQSGIVVKNAKNLGINLKELDAIILSHGHYDHTGGLEHVLEITGPIDIYGHPKIFEKKWTIDKTEKRDIGTPISLEKLEKMGVNLHLSAEPMKISDNVWTSGEIPRKSAELIRDPKLYVEQEGHLVPDMVLDDLALYIADKDGVSIIFGCNHAGLDNTLQHIDNQVKIDKIKLLIGGLHLFESDEEQILENLNVLNKFKIEKIAVSHCTGFEAAVILKNHFKNKFETAAVGSCFSI